jgi:hypothetical protein
MDCNWVADDLKCQKILDSVGNVCCLLIPNYITFFGYLVIIYSLFNDAVSIYGYMASNDRVTGE